LRSTRDWLETEEIRLNKLLMILLTVAGLGACTQHKIEVEPTHHTIEVKPIHITVDVNIRVDRQLDHFFAFEDEMAGAIEADAETAQKESL